jgi:hypothetical protein
MTLELAQDAPRHSMQRLVRLSVMHAVYVRDEGVDWQLFSAEPNLECAKTTASVLEVTRPNSDCCIVPPNSQAQPPKVG